VSDRLALAHAFEDAGIERAKAEHVAQVVLDAIRDNVATKADLDGVRSDLRSDLRSVRAELKSDVAALKYDLTMRGLLGLSAGLSALFAALHYWPPH
jgi:hypothetical protein